MTSASSSVMLGPQCYTQTWNDVCSSICHQCNVCECSSIHQSVSVMMFVSVAVYVISVMFVSVAVYIISVMTFVSIYHQCNDVCEYMSSV